jgi:DNA-binding beta-propeller fold protein YncE
VKNLLVAVMLGTLAGSAWSAETYEAPLSVRTQPLAKLTAGPTARRVDGGAEITFTASAATDVEVAILDGKGKIIRHLAAGLLGDHAPAPLERGTLEQTLRWDGRDDAGVRRLGKNAGAFSVRVRLGATPKLDRYVGRDGNRLERVRGLCVSPGGEVFAMVSIGSRGSNDIRVFDRSGKYKRTILPYSTITPYKRTESVGQIKVGGRRIPVVFNGHGHALSPLTVGLPRQTMAWNPKGHLVVVSTLETPFEHGLPRHLLAFHPHGGAPDGMKFVGPEIRPPRGILWGVGEANLPAFEHVACSVDGRYVYYTHSTYRNHHAVFRMSWGEDKGEGMEAGFIGIHSHPGSDDKHLNDPQGLAVDPKGRIYVCDRGNARVMIYSAKGEPLGKFGVKAPEQIAVHPETGEMYVACNDGWRFGPPKDTGPMPMSEYRRWKTRRAERWKTRPKRTPPALLKFSAFEPGKEPRQLARLDKGFGHIALDPSADPPRLWAVEGRNRVLPVVDRGDRFEVGKPINSSDGLHYPIHVTADPARNRALIVDRADRYTAQALDLETGKTKKFVSGISQIALAPDGTFVATARAYGQGLLRFDADGKPLNWPGSESPVAPTPKFAGLGHGFGQRGLCVAPNGDIYFNRNGRGGGRGVQNCVVVYGPDGKQKGEPIIDGMGIGDCGLGVDAAGNIYIGANVKPMTRLLPDNLKGVVSNIPWLCWAQGQWGYRPAPWYYSMRNEYLYHVGAVFKFGPGGGKLYGHGSLRRVPDPKLSPLTNAANAPENAPEYRTGYLMQRVKVVGAKWRYPGMGLLPSSERQWGDPSCVCVHSRLDVDPYGRVYMPDCFRFGVDILDAAGNRIGRLGTYGNADDRGPEIHLAWPAAVDFGPDGRLYVADSVNTRLVVIRFTFADEGRCPVK